MNTCCRTTLLHDTFTRLHNVNGNAYTDFCTKSVTNILCVSMKSDLYTESIVYKMHHMPFSVGVFVALFVVPALGQGKFNLTFYAVDNACVQLILMMRC